MMRELFLENVSLCECVWQSTSFALVGLVGSFLLRRRPARASQVLLLALIAAVAVPAMDILVRHFELGVFVAEPVALKAEMPAEFVPVGYETSVVVPPSADIADENTAVEGQILVETGSAQTHISWRLLVLCGWMVASLILLGRLFVAVVSGVNLLRRAQPSGCEQIRRTVDSAGSKLAITGNLRIRSSGGVLSPVIWCWSRPPVLLVPNGLDRKIGWVGVICHELAHCRRKDHITGLIAEIVVCILPWNPLLWWSKKRMIRFSEQACDDWVVADGQSREDYAQSLLDFKPQKQVAFVPAVVSSKKTLAGRVRRILKDSCSNPRTGAAWALTASAIAICLAVGIAFAQTRPARSTGTIKTKVGPSAVIERPAFATMTIRGKVLDSDNKPAVARIIALPDTSFGTQTTVKDKDGNFELPWSPTWIERGQPVYLIAKSGHSTPRGDSRRDEAAVVEVSDPTQPVTIRLEPARLSLEGKVVDVNGQRLPKYRARLSLLTEFKCRAPIFDTTVGFPRERIISPIPYGTEYKLTIEAEGYQTKQVTVDATDRSKEIIDIGTITLQPQDPARPAVAERGLNGALQKEFQDIYRLDAGEVIKFIKPPFVLGRQEYLHSQPFDVPFTLQQGPAWQAGFRWDDELKASSGSGPSPLSLKSILRFILDIQYHDFDLPQDLSMRMPHGDWIVRHDLPMAEQLTALGDILHAERGRSIRFEKRIVERDVIIAKGRYEFKPHPNGNYPEHVHLTWDGAVERGSGGVNSLAQLFGRLEWETEVEIVDDTEPMENTSIQYKMGDIRQISRDPELRGERLRALADNLAKTTSLQFKVERRPAEMWFVTEARND